MLSWDVTSGEPPQATDPPAPPLISIVDPAGTTQLNAVSMTQDGVGKYSFVYTTPAGGVLGVWKTFATATDAGGVVSGSVDVDAFELV